MGRPERAQQEPGGAYRNLFHPDRSQLMFQIQEIFERETYLQRGVELEPGATVLDIGANVGVAASFFAERGAATVHCFEPIAPIREILERNVAPFSQCVVHPYGLAARSGSSKITYYPNADAMSGLFADPERDAALAEQCMRNIGFDRASAAVAVEGRYRPEVLECELRTVSAVLAERSIETVDLLKIDVERAEVEVLAGLDDADWPRIRQVVAEIHDEDGHIEAVLDSVRSHGFEASVEQDGGMAGTDVHLLYAVRRSG